MTGYQKLKKENEFLWDTIERMLTAMYQDNEDPNYEEHVKKEIAWLKWKVEDETNQEKN